MRTGDRRGGAGRAVALGEAYKPEHVFAPGSLHLMTSATAARPASPRGFFAWSAIAMATIVGLSFPLTYYLPALSGTKRFDLLHHAHGLAFFGWFALYVWQTELVARGQVARHREIGLAGFALTGAMIPLGLWMSQRAAELRRAAGAARPYEVTWYNLVDMSLFAGLMLASILLVTRRKEWHRRLTFVAALCLTAPAATRWTLKFPLLDPLPLDLFVYLVMDPFLLALAWHDRRTLGRVHPATLTCIALLLPLQISSAWIARSTWWNAVAPGLVGPP